MRQDKITLAGVAVEIDWDRMQACHTVPSSDLDEGCADGPCDGYTFAVDGKTYKLGEHDYDVSDGETTCYTSFWPVGSEEAESDMERDRR